MYSAAKVLRRPCGRFIPSPPFPSFPSLPLPSRLSLPFLSHLSSPPLPLEVGPLKSS